MFWEVLGTPVDLLAWERQVTETLTGPDAPSLERPQREAPRTKAVVSSPRKPAAAGTKSATTTEAAAQYDEDGVRDVWDSSPPAEIRAERERWRAVPLRDKVRACFAHNVCLGK